MRIRRDRNAPQSLPSATVKGTTRRTSASRIVLPTQDVCPCGFDRPLFSLAWNFIPNAGGQAAVGPAVMLEPFLQHIFSVFDNSRHISTRAVRDNSVWNSGDRPRRRVFMLIPVHAAGLRRINLAARNFASISATADNW
jgi:hypothetical protein